MNRERWIAFTVIALMSLSLSLMMASMDSEVRSLQDLLQLQNMPAIVVLSAMIYGMVTGLYWSVRNQHIGLFILTLAVECVLLGGFLWSFGSHASTNLGQLRNFVLLSAVVGVFLTCAVTTAYGAGKLGAAKSA